MKISHNNLDFCKGIVRVCLRFFLPIIVTNAHLDTPSCVSGGDKKNVGE
jgi:hypothetical protein